jgi:peptidoglycan/xylan/chitin deacetylase (PgdA/CDA1 family)
MARKDAFSLCYHAISASWTSPISVTPDQFAAQIELLARRGYRAVTFSEAVAEPGRRVVAITFDDGYRSVLELAKPILDHYGMPATVFVVTSFVGTDRPVKWPGVDHLHGAIGEAELVPMGWPQLAELAGSGWEIGSHTRTHAYLPGLGDEQLVDELGGSMRDCEEAIGMQCRSLSYPYGDYDERAVSAARRCGYGAAGTLMPALLGHGEPLAAPRIGIYQGDDGGRFRRKVSRTVLGFRSSRAGLRLQQARRQTRRSRGRRLNATVHK